MHELSLLAARPFRFGAVALAFPYWLFRVRLSQSIIRVYPPQNSFSSFARLSLLSLPDSPPSTVYSQGKKISVTSFINPFSCLLLWHT